MTIPEGELKISREAWKDRRLVKKLKRRKNGGRGKSAEALS